MWRLESNVFGKCANLKSIVLNHGLESLHGDAFDDTAIEEITLPETVMAVQGRIKTDYFTSFHVDPENTRFCSVNGILYSKDMEEIVQCPIQYEGEVVIPDGVRYVRHNAFYHCKHVTGIVFPDSVWALDWSCAEGCENLHTVIMGSGLKIISEKSFAWCKNLSSVEFGQNVEEVSDYAFRCCESLTKVVLPDSIKKFNSTVFEACPNLTELTMPEWMESRRQDIMDYASGKKHTGW